MDLAAFIAAAKHLWSHRSRKPAFGTVCVLRAQCRSLAAVTRMSCWPLAGVVNELEIWGLGKYSESTSVG